MREGKELTQDHKASKCWPLDSHLDLCGYKARLIKHCAKNVI